MAASWVKTITTPFKKACTFLNHQQQQPSSARDKKSKPELDDFTGHQYHHHHHQHENTRAMDLQGEVMACAYEDVQVMWSMLDKSKANRACNVSS